MIFEVKINGSGDEIFSEYLVQESVLSTLQFLCSVVYKAIIFEITEVLEISEEASKTTMIDFRGKRKSVFDIFKENPDLKYISYEQMWLDS